MGVYVTFLLVSQIFTGTQHWNEVPNILICHNSQATVYRTERAIKYWQDLGHRFGTIKKADKHNFNCVTGVPPSQTIMIDIPSQDFKFNTHLGTTKTWWHTTTGEIIKAKIEIKNGWENTQRIIEHEIGHALGYSDNTIRGHMMNGSWISGGYDNKNLKKQND